MEDGLVDISDADMFALFDDETDLTRRQAYEEMGRRLRESGGSIGISSITAIRPILSPTMSSFSRITSP